MAMADEHATLGGAPAHSCLGPAQPLWRVVPTHGGDGRCLADFMMLIPQLGSGPRRRRDQVTQSIRDVCESYGDRVAFADINYSINVLWVSVVAEPGLGGRVAASVRQRVPEALLVGGQLATAGALQGVARRPGFWRQRLRRLSRRAAVLLGAPDS
jgi:hypothetical protein